MAELKDILPPPKEALTLPPEELGLCILKFLNKIPPQAPINRNNFISESCVIPYAGREQCDAMMEALMEAWMWLVHDGFIAQKPKERESIWVFITRRGKELANSADEGDFKAYIYGHLLPSEILDPVLNQRVRPLFIRGDYDTAIFRAFREVETRTRNATSLSIECIGVQLMRKAFDKDRGPLRKSGLPESEREALAHLFAGAIGVFKNPTSHRNWHIDNPAIAAEIITFANMLLRIIEIRKKKI